MPKRGESIWKRKNGRWEARYIKERDLNGKAIYGSVYGATYTEVKKKRESVLGQLSEKQKAKIAPNTFEFVIKEYLEAHKLEVKQSTYARYIEISTKHLIPDFSTKNIADFALEDGNSYVKTLLDSKKADGSGLAPKTVKDIISLLKQTLKYAERKEYIASAKTDFILPKQERPHVQILSSSQQKCLESFVCTTSDSYKFGVYLCLYTGMRIGEVCALQWKDIDCVNSTISVNKTVLRVKNTNTADNAKTKIIISTPKTSSSERIIPLTSALRKMLLQLKLTISPTGNDYLLTGTSKLIEPRNYYERYKRYLRSCNLSGFNFHALRHTFATRCIEVGVDPKVLSEILGHASVQITLDRYVHPTLEAKRNCLEKLFSA